jgi:hypothetical protein
MFTPSKTILSAVAVLCLLGAAGPARASDHNGQDHTYGGPVQTWCDINPDCNGWSKGVYRTSFEDGASAAVASSIAKPRPAHKSRHEAGNR